MNKLPVYFKIAIILFGLTNFFFILSAGRAFFIPLAVAFLLSLLLMPICRKLESWKFPRSLAIIVCILIIIAVLGGAIGLIITQFMQFGSEIPAIADKLSKYAESLQQFIEETFNITADSQSGYLEGMLENALQSSGAVLTSTATGTLGVLMNILLLILYIFFFMYYRNFFTKVIYRAFDDDQHSRVESIIKRVQHVIQNYIVGIFTVVLILTVLNTTGLFLIGINYAFFFGAIAGLLNILPFVGVFIGSALPVIYAFISKDSIWYPLGVMGMFAFIQTLESSIFTPNIVGSKVSLNPFAAILALILGGQLWGPVGMILFIPFTAILKVICDEIPTLQPLGMLLGDPNKEIQEEPHFFRGISDRYKSFKKSRQTN